MGTRKRKSGQRDSGAAQRLQGQAGLKPNLAKQGGEGLPRRSVGKRRAGAKHEGSLVPGILTQAQWVTEGGSFTKQVILEHLMYQALF